jgi:hypothetical protein
MESGEDDRDGLIHPAFQARISQVSAYHQMHVSQMAAASRSTLEDTAASLRRTAEAMARYPEVAKIASLVDVTLTLVSASLRRWSSGKVPTAVEYDALVRCLNVANDGLAAARRLCASHASAPSNAFQNLPDRCPEDRDHSDERS